MAASPSLAFLDGRVLPFEGARIPLDDRGLLFGESLYEVAPIVDGQVRLVAEHVERMVRGAEHLGLRTDGLTADGWKRMAEDLGGDAPLEEGLLYVQLTGGSAVRSHVPDAAPPPRLFAYLVAHHFPRARETNAGVRAILVPETRWARRDLKTTMLLPAVLAQRRARAQDAGEALFVGDDDRVSEGTSSNVFIVDGGTLVTPARSAALLPGVTRQITIEAAWDLDLPVRESPVAVPDLWRADEVFISSTSRLTMPVLAIDDRELARGPIAGRLAQAIRNRLGLR